MAKVRIALANIPYPENRDDAVARVVGAIGDASAAGAMVVCFPECYVPGYRTAARRIVTIEFGSNCLAHASAI